MVQVQGKAEITKSQAVVHFLTKCWRWCCQIALVQPRLRGYFEPLIRLFNPGYRAGLISAQLLSVSQQQGYLHLLLKPGKKFRAFVPGQHLQLSVELDGALVQRTFSVSSPLQQFLTQGTVQLTLKIQPHAGLTQRLAARAGENLFCYVSQAQGDFVLDQQHSALIVVAGSGITPVHAMLCSLSRLTQPVRLIYSYRGADNLLFASSWPELKARFPLLQIELWDTSCRPRLSAAALGAAFAALQQQQKAAHSAPQAEPCVLYLCGPQTFSQQWQQQAKTLGILQVRQESFGSLNAADGEAVTVSARQHGRLVMLKSQGNLLQSLEQAGLSPRYGCRRGICMQCLCQKSAGVVRNELTGQISGAGAGLVQLCISTALTTLELQLDAVSTAAQDNTPCTT